MPKRIKETIEDLKDLAKQIAKEPVVREAAKVVAVIIIGRFLKPLIRR